MRIYGALIACTFCMGLVIGLDPEQGFASTSPDTSGSKRVFALTWHEPPASAEHLAHFVWVYQKADQLTAQLGRLKAKETLARPEGRRALFFKRLPYHLMGLHTKGHYGDRTIATILREDIQGEQRTTVHVAPLPYRLEKGHEIIIKGRHGATYAYLSEDANQGDTTLVITDKWGAVHIDAQDGSQVLSNFQSPWLDSATGLIKQAMQRFMQGFVDAGGELDYLILDFEGGIRTWEHCGTGLFSAIANDPRWDDPGHGIGGQSLRGRLAPYSIERVCDRSNGNDGYLHWNALQFDVTAHALNEAIFSVAKEHFPKLEASNYWHSGVSRSEAKHAPDNNGHFQHKQAIFGTHGSSSFYGNIRNLAGKSHSLGLDRPYGVHPFAALRWMVKRARAIWRSNEGRIMPWIAFEEWVESEFPGTPYYNELVYHLALTGSGPILYWNPQKGDWNEYGVRSDAEQELRVDSMLGAVRARTTGRANLITTGEISWGSKVVATAVHRSSGDALWRISVPRVNPSDQRPIEVVVRVEGRAFGDTLTIPAGQAGTWYVHPDPDQALTFEIDAGLSGATGSVSKRGVELLGNHPNPFQGSTTIQYYLPQPMRAIIDVYNARGQQVSRLVNDDQFAGLHRVQVSSGAAASGRYLFPPGRRGHPGPHDDMSAVGLRGRRGV